MDNIPLDFRLFHAAFCVHVMSSPLGRIFACDNTQPVCAASMHPHGHYKVRLEFRVLSTANR